MVCIHCLTAYMCMGMWDKPPLHRMQMDIGQYNLIWIYCSFTKNLICVHPSLSVFIYPSTGPFAQHETVGQLSSNFKSLSPPTLLGKSHNQQICISKWYGLTYLLGGWHCMNTFRLCGFLCICLVPPLVFTECVVYTTLSVDSMTIQIKQL